MSNERLTKRTCVARPEYSMGVAESAPAPRPSKTLGVPPVIVALALVVVSRIAVAQGFSPEEAERRFVTTNGLKATVFASEPEVRQAIFVKCDDRGRLWT